LFNEHYSKGSLTNCQYNGREIDTLEPDIDARVVELIDLLRTKYSDTVVDIAAITRFFTLDVLSTVAFGRPFGFMAANADLWDYDKTTTQAMLLLEWVVNHASFRWLFQSSLVQALAAPKSTDSRGMGPMLGFARAAVAERFGPDPKVKKDMLGHFVGKGLSQLRCEVEANLQIVAGSDSTTTVLRSTLFLLAGTPLSYAKLRAEIDSATNDGSLSYPVTSYTEAQKLPYLTACLWEGLRMYPPLFGLKSKMAPPGGDTFKGVYYPEGAEVALCDDALCRNVEIFGSDAHLFRPDRWITADTANRVKYRQTVDAVFGSGRFMCLGRHIAMMELHKATVEVRKNITRPVDIKRQC
jgi:cytochrome P450